MNRTQRFREFLDRLGNAPAASSSKEALNVLAEKLNAVEDEYSGVIYDPSKYQSDGRLYPPQPDSCRSVDGRPDLKRYRSLGHNTFIKTNGAILIQSIPEANVNPIVHLSKPGADGNVVEI